MHMAPTMHTVVTVSMAAVLFWMADMPCARGSEVRRKAENTVLMRVQFRDAGFDEVVESLQDLAERYDPEREGINIVNMVPGDHPVPRITLSLRRVSLLETIRYITEMAGLTYRIDDRAVIITTRDERPDRIITRTYPVQPTFLDVIRGGRKEEKEPRRDDWWGW